MLRITRRVALAAALGTAIGLGIGTATASASTTISDLPDKAPIISKLYVPVPLTISCDAPSPFFSFFSATIRQVVTRRQIAHGTGSISGLSCDGTPHIYTVNVFPDAGGPFTSDSPPFKKGDAVVNAQVSTSVDFVTTGPQPIRLTK